MKSRTIEIIDNHIEELEEELEWYQDKNLEWQKESNEWLEKTEWIQQEADGGRFAGYHRADVIKTLFDELRAKLSERRYTGIRIDGTWLDFEELQQENARLRDQLRWHSVDELPKKETANCSITVLLDIDYVGVFKVYYNFLFEIWIGVQGKQEYFRAEDFKNTKARWCYIPDDNQGTDCTPEGR